jgi:hypothetical protein
VPYFFLVLLLFWRQPAIQFRFGDLDSFVMNGIANLPSGADFAPGCIQLD